MMKRMILSGLLAVTAVPALASDASYDVKAASATASKKADAGAKAESAARHECSCQHHRA